MAFRQIFSEVLRKPEALEKPIRTGTLRFILNFMSPFWKLGIISVVLTLIAGALGSLIPLCAKIVIDFVLLKQGIDRLENMLETLHLASIGPFVIHVLSSLNPVLFMFFILGITTGLLGIAQKYTSLKFQQDVTFHIQTSLFDRILRYPVSLLRKKQVGYLMSRVSDDVTMLQYFFSGAVPQFFTNTFYLLFSFMVIFKLHLKTALILSAFLPVWIGIFVFFAARTRSVSMREMESRAGVSESLQETFSGIEVIRTHTAESKELARISKKISVLFYNRLKSVLVAALSENTMKMTRLASILAVVWLCVGEIQKSGMTIGDMTTLLTYVLFLSGMASGIANSLLMFQTADAAIQRIREMFDIIPETEPLKSGDALEKPRDFSGGICFENVCFSYEKEKPVLQGVSFFTNPGEVTILTGPSGAGKTTMVHLLLKFIRPVSGNIFIDDIAIDRIDTEFLRQRIGFVSQDIFLFNDTIENNIRYGKPSASPEKVSEAARIAGIHEEITRMPKGYRTLVGERGVMLSAGQRQRISIARAFLKNPAILICDEPTSALDMKTEKIVHDALLQLAVKRTVLVITHRMEVAGGATRVLRLENGKIRVCSEKCSA